jgi:hypothetical protein
MICQIMIRRMKSPGIAFTKWGAEMALGVMVDAFGVNDSRQFLISAG